MRRRRGFLNSCALCGDEGGPGQSRVFHPTSPSAEIVCVGCAARALASLRAHAIK